MVKMAIDYDALLREIFTYDNRDKSRDDYHIEINTPHIAIREDVYQQLINPSLTEFAMERDPFEDCDFRIIDIRENPNFLAYPVMINKEAVMPRLVKNDTGQKVGRTSVYNVRKELQ